MKKRAAVARGANVRRVAANTIRGADLAVAPTGEGAMTLERVLENAECRLFELGKRFCTDRAADLRDQADQLEQELRRAYDTVSECRATTTATRRRIAAGEVKATLLTGQVETSLLKGDEKAAWELALQLDQVRRQLQADRTQLPYLETACRNRQGEVAGLERRLGRVYEQLPA
jgi:hypothetical protein